MQLVERHVAINNTAIENICFKSARLYNFVNYHKRQAFFGKQEKFTEYEISGLCNEFDQSDFRNLPAQSAQQVIKQVFKSWKSYFAALKEFKKNPKGFTGKPKPPKYKDKTGHGVTYFTNQQINLKDGYVHFPKITGLEPIKTKVTKVNQVRIVPQSTCFVIEIVYEINEQALKPDNQNVLALDLGVSNLVAAIDTVGNKPFLINGGRIKSVNNYFNKTNAMLMSYVGNKGTSNRIKRLTHKRNCIIQDMMHKTSRYIVNYCIDNEINTIVIGHNKGWKDEVNLGKKTNQKFVCIPHSTLICMVQYKARMAGINVKENNESHTSKCDHLALEPICHQRKYLGKRVKRGLFQSSTGKLLNADVNGGLGILLKSNVIRNAKGFISTLLDNGLAFNPVKINIS